mgnify:CR=1 FL=1
MVSLRKNEEEQKMQGIRMDVRSAFLRHREALQRVEALNCLSGKRKKITVLCRIVI